jgi:hypothetical protein
MKASRTCIGVATSIVFVLIVLPIVWHKQATSPKTSRLIETTVGRADIGAMQSKEINKQIESGALELNPAPTDDLAKLDSLTKRYQLALDILEKQIADDHVKAQLNRRDLSGELRAEYFARIRRVTKLRVALLEVQLNKINSEFALRTKSRGKTGSSAAPANKKAGV